ncbi:MAG: cysteine desulfurase [Deltaproteobacteria bacterium]|nr:cysteine desulfurase [Deltaproteobacteria bacterium]
MIYLDYNATTPVAPEVAAAMQPFLGPEFGNPSCDYPLGLRAREAMRQARREVAALLNCAPDEVVFTSGATEANNLVLKGVAFSRGRGRIITALTEHPAVLNPCLFLDSLGFKLTILPVDAQGLVDPEAVLRALTADTIMISIMHSNNETGALAPIKDIAAIAREAGVPLHTDAAQSVGKVKVDVEELGVDFLTVAGHKFYAPKGVGALFMRRGRELTPLLHGASQEGGHRAGTENLPYIAALGEACRLAKQRQAADAAHLRGLRDLLHKKLRAGFPGLVLNGPEAERLPSTLNVSFPGLAGCDLMAGVPEVAASLGSACHAGRETVSPVLAAMGISAVVARGAVRFSVGRPTTREDIEKAAELVLKQAHVLARK